MHVRLQAWIGDVNDLRIMLERRNQWRLGDGSIRLLLRRCQIGSLVYHEYPFCCWCPCFGEVDEHTSRTADARIRRSKDLKRSPSWRKMLGWIPSRATVASGRHRRLGRIGLWDWRWCTASRPLYRVRPRTKWLAPYGRPSAYGAVETTWSCSWNVLCHRWSSSIALSP